MSILQVYGILQVLMFTLSVLIVLGSADRPDKETVRISWSVLDTYVDFFFFLGLFLYICWRGDHNVTFAEGMVFGFIAVTQIFNMRFRSLSEAMKNVE
jgi:NhaP-type Na+/H+ or K+/H+ antiporter